MEDPWIAVWSPLRLLSDEQRTQPERSFLARTLTHLGNRVCIAAVEDNYLSR